jgi:hypothetical protein
MMKPDAQAQLASSCATRAAKEAELQAMIKNLTGQLGNTRSLAEGLQSQVKADWEKARRRMDDKEAAVRAEEAELIGNNEAYPK